MALLNLITDPWECELAPPFSLCAMWLLLRGQGPSVLKGSQSPEGKASPQCPEAPSLPQGYLEAGVWECACSVCRGATSVCLGCLHMCATYIHLWAHSSMPCAC